MQALVPSLWKGSPPYETRGEPADASRERFGSNGSGSGGGPASVEEKRILATRMQKAANNGFDVLPLLEKGADPTAAGVSLPPPPDCRLHTNTVDVACAHSMLAGWGLQSFGCDVEDWTRAAKKSSQLETPRGSAPARCCACVCDPGTRRFSHVEFPPTCPCFLPSWDPHFLTACCSRLQTSMVGLRCTMLP